MTIWHKGWIIKNILWLAFAFSEGDWKRVEEAAEILYVWMLHPFLQQLITLWYYKDANNIQQYFSTEKHPTLWHALPAIEELQTAWEAKWDDDHFLAYQTAINDGLKKLNKYYLWFDKKPAYIIALSMSFFELHVTIHPTFFLDQAPLIPWPYTSQTSHQCSRTNHPLYSPVLCHPTS